MCRFVAYKGKEKVVLNSLLGESQNSLIIQSRFAKETKTGLNADGFGMGWYNHEVSHEPAVFKSILPAWNDSNLINISSKVSSDCFIGHIRASTVGDVSMANCHPFKYKQYLFVHNGTIYHFNKIKKSLVDCLSDEYYSNIKGQTDSEYFFMLLCQILETELSQDDPLRLTKALALGIKKINELHNKHDLKLEYRINVTLTDGEGLVAMRCFSGESRPPLSLYYSSSEDSVIVASECLTEETTNWKEVPPNNIVFIDRKLNICCKPMLNKIPDCV